jgi:hypothetical protein
MRMGATMGAGSWELGATKKFFVFFKKSIDFFVDMW